MFVFPFVGGPNRVEALIVGGKINDRGQDRAPDYPQHLVPIEEGNADPGRLDRVVERRPQYGDELDDEEEIPPPPAASPFAALIHAVPPGSVSGRVGAGDGNRTHDTQLGKLMFYH